MVSLVLPLTCWYKTFSITKFSKLSLQMFFGVPDSWGSQFTVLPKSAVKIIFRILPFYLVTSSSLVVCYLQPITFFPSLPLFDVHISASLFLSPEQSSLLSIFSQTLPVINILWMRRSLFFVSVITSVPLFFS